MISRLDNTMAADEEIARRVIGLAMKVHRALGCGFLESVYAKALLIELASSKVSYERERIFPVIYKGVEVGLFQADLFVEKRLIIELKSVETLAVAHSVQLVNYLAASQVDLGLLLNFGAKSLQFRTKTRVYQPAEEPPRLQT